jgi:hypothetical protein
MRSGGGGGGFHGGGHHGGGGFSHHHGGYRGGGGTVVFFGGGPGYYYTTYPVRCVSCICIFLFVFALILIVSLAPRTHNGPSSGTPMVSGEAFLAACSSPWISGIETTTDAASVGYIAVYRTNGVPPVAALPPRTDQRTLSISYGSYEYYSYYGLSGSVYSLNYSLSSYVDFYVLYGDKQFDDWSSGGYYQSIYYGSTFSGKYTLSADDMIYFVWEAAGTSTGVVNINVAENVYNVQNPLETCTSYSCTINFADGDCAVIAATPPTPSPDTTVLVDYRVIAKSSTYWMIGGIILAVLVVITVGAVAFVACRKRANYTTSPEVSPVAPPASYGAAYGAPPAYAPQYK